MTEDDEPSDAVPLQARLAGALAILNGLSILLMVIAFMVDVVINVGSSNSCKAMLLSLFVAVPALGFCAAGLEVYLGTVPDPVPVVFLTGICALIAWIVAVVCALFDPITAAMASVFGLFFTVTYVLTVRSRVDYLNWRASRGRP